MLSNSRQAERADLEERLAVAEVHVTRARKHVMRQREIAEDLESKGHSQIAVMARGLLCLFEEITAVHTADRDRLTRSLAELR